MLILILFLSLILSVILLVRQKGHKYHHKRPPLDEVSALKLPAA